MDLDLADWVEDARPLIAAAVERRQPYRGERYYLEYARDELRTCLVAMGLIHRASEPSRCWDGWPPESRSKEYLNRGAGYGALLDVLRFLTECNVPLPRLIADEARAAVLAVAVGAGDRAHGGPATPGVAVRRNVIRRLRFEHMERVLFQADHNEWERTAMLPAQVRQYLASGMRPEWRPLSREAHARIVAAQPKASSVSREAAGIVRSSLKETHLKLYGSSPEPVAGGLPDEDTATDRKVPAEMVSRDWRKVWQIRNAMIMPSEAPGIPDLDDLPRCWPGEFYLPSAATLEALGMDDLTVAMTPWSIPSDAPTLPPLNLR